MDRDAWATRSCCFWRRRTHQRIAAVGSRDASRGRRLQDQLDALNAEPDCKGEKRDIFEDRRKIVQTLVEHVNIGKDRRMSVVFRLHVLALLNQAESDPVQSKQVGTCSRIR
jgi:hypothetical protein